MEKDGLGVSHVTVMVGTLTQLATRNAASTVSPQLMAMVDRTASSAMPRGVLPAHPAIAMDRYDASYDSPSHGK